HPQIVRLGQMGVGIDDLQRRLAVIAVDGGCGHFNAPGEILALAAPGAGCFRKRTYCFNARPPPAKTLVPCEAAASVAPRTGRSRQTKAPRPPSPRPKGR